MVETLMYQQQAPLGATQKLFIMPNSKKQLINK